MRAGEEVGASFMPSGRGPEKQVMIDEVAFEGIEIGLKSALVFHDARQLANDPVGEAEPLGDLWLRFLFGWHFLKRDLCPDRFPDGGIGLIDPPQIEQIEISLGGEIVVAFVTMFIQKTRREIP